VAIVDVAALVKQSMACLAASNMRECVGGLDDKACILLLGTWDETGRATRPNMGEIFRTDGIFQLSESGTWRIPISLFLDIIAVSQIKQPDCNH
jgi:hypothetical protein